MIRIKTHHEDNGRIEVTTERHPNGQVFVTVRRKAKPKPEPVDMEDGEFELDEVDDE